MSTPIKDHVIAETVNQLREVAVQFHAAQQLRQRIADIVVPILKGPVPIAQDDGYSTGFKDGQKAEREKCRSLLSRIAEIDGLIECTNLANWRDRVKQMAANFLKGK